MLNIPESIWAHLGSSSFYPAVLPIVIGGGLAIFKPWLISEEQIRERADLKKQALMEKTNKSLQHVLSRLQDSDFGLEDLRGASEIKKSRSGLETSRPKQPDLISNYMFDFLNTITVITKLFRIYEHIRTCYWLLFLTAAIGVIGLLTALPIESARPYISASCYPIVGFQIVIAFMIRRWTSRFEECERAS